MKATHLVSQRKREFLFFVLDLSFLFASSFSVRSKTINQYCDLQANSKTGGRCFLSFVFSIETQNCLLFFFYSSFWLKTASLISFCKRCSKEKALKSEQQTKKDNEVSNLTVIQTLCVAHRESAAIPFIVCSFVVLCCSKKKREVNCVVNER